MNFNFMLSLEDMAVVRTAIMLWNHEDNRELLEKNFSTNDLQETQRVWLDVEAKIIEKVAKLPLPKLLLNRLLNIIKPIGLEMLKWSVYHGYVLKTDRKDVRESLNKLCWTAQGTVDRKKTAEILINDKNFKTFNRYKLACIYCLENDIPKLWTEMSEYERRKTETLFHLRNLLRPESSKETLLVVFWTYYIKGEEAELQDTILKRCKRDRISSRNYSSDCFMFQNAAITNKSATEYFFKKLNCRQKKKLFVRTAQAANNCTCTQYHPYLCNSDVVFFLLSQMSNELQRKVFQDKYYIVLQRLLDWPWQSFFQETASRMSKSYLVRHPTSVLLGIVNKVRDGYRDYNYQMLFREIWQLTRNDNLDKKIHISYRSIVARLLIVEDKENVELILNDATPSQREKFIFSDEGMETCESLISNDKWDTLQFFIQKCIPCKSKRDEFKVKFKNYQKRINRKENERQEKISRINILVDHLAQEINTKRSKGEEEYNPAKRLCSIEFRK